MSTCKDCLHFVACEEVPTKSADDCDFFKDRFRFVELPCKVGKEVYVIQQRGNFKPRVFSKFVEEIRIKVHREIDERGWNCVVDGKYDYSIKPLRSKIINSNEIFNDLEEAERALKEREK